MHAESRAFGWCPATVRYPRAMRRAWVEFWSEAAGPYFSGYLELHRWVVEKDPAADPRAPRVGRWEPPLAPVAGRGWPRICLEVDDGVVLVFVSTLEMVTAARVLDTDLVDPETAKARWYRKLPASVKSAHARHDVAARIRAALAAYEAQLDAIAARPIPIPKKTERRPELLSSAELRV